MGKTYLLQLLTLPAFTGCKKEKATDYGAAIVDKVWVGTFNYTNGSIEHYSIHFKADSSFILSDHNGDWNGDWGIADDQLIISLGGEIKASISDNKFVNISNNPNNDWELKSGELSNTFNEEIESTYWKGRISGDELTISFMPGGTIGVSRASNVIYYGLYTRTGASIRFGGWPSFAVIMPDGKAMKGGKTGSGEGPWTVVKQ
jgi:hypothetical protein